MKVNNTKELFNALNIDEGNTLSISQKKFLLDEGYLILHKKIRGKVLKIKYHFKRIYQKERTKGGWEEKRHYKNGKEFDPGNNRLGNLIDKNKLFKELIKIP